MDYRRQKALYKPSKLSPVAWCFSLCLC